MLPHHRVCSVVLLADYCLSNLLLDPNSNHGLCLIVIFIYVIEDFQKTFEYKSLRPHR